MDAREEDLGLLRDDPGLVKGVRSVPLDDGSEVLDSFNRSGVEVLETPNSQRRRVLDSYSLTHRL